MSDHETLLDIKEAARFLNVSETSLRRWTNSGRLACLRIGRRRERRFRRADLLAFLEQPDASTTDVGGLLATSPATLRAELEGDSIPNGTHLCGLYGTDLDRVRLAVTFLTAGLVSSGVAVVIAPPESRTAILRALEARIPSLPELTRTGRVISADHEASPDAQIEFFHTRFTSAMTAGATSFRVVGDLSGFAKRAGVSAVARYEAAYASAIASRYPVVTLCAYDVRHFSGADLLLALRAHPDTLAHPERVV